MHNPNSNEKFNNSFYQKKNNLNENYFDIDLKSDPTGLINVSKKRIMPVNIKLDHNTNELAENSLENNIKIRKNSQTNYSCLQVNSDENILNCEKEEHLYSYSSRNKLLPDFDSNHINNDKFEIEINSNRNLLKFNSKENSCSINNSNCDNKTVSNNSDNIADKSHYRNLRLKTLENKNSKKKK